MTEKPKGTLNFSLRGQKKVESKITVFVNGDYKEPIGTQLRKKKHTAQSAGKRKWQVAINSFESD